MSVSCLIRAQELELEFPEFTHLVCSKIYSDGPKTKRVKIGHAFVLGLLLRNNEKSFKCIFSHVTKLGRNDPLTLPKLHKWY